MSEKKYLAKILAKDPNGLQVISACCSEGIVKIDEIKFLKKNKLFLLSIERLNKEKDEKQKINSICKHGNPNVLTRDKGTSKLGQGPIAHSCLIEMEKYKNKLPKVTAHEPPIIIRPDVNLN